jgi:hypothetical protein
MLLFLLPFFWVMDLRLKGVAELRVALLINGGAINGSRAWDFEGGVTEAEEVAIAATKGILSRMEQVEVADEEEVVDGGLEQIQQVL